MVEHPVSVEEITPLEGATLEKFGHPQGVVFPHFLVRDCIDRRPQGQGFFAFVDASFETLASEDVHPNRVAIAKLETQIAPSLRVGGIDANFLPHFAQYAITDALTGLESSARSDDLSRAEAALLADQEKVSFDPDEAECADVDGGPPFPVDFANVRCAGVRVRDGSSSARRRRFRKKGDEFEPSEEL